jgi:cytochrome c-type biogenesis protein CcmH
VKRLSQEVRCPTCRGLSAAESDAKAAQAVRAEIRSRVAAGQRDEDIRAYLASRYGDDILLRPEGSGASALVWALPVVVVVCGAAGLAFAFRRWKVAGP